MSSSGTESDSSASSDVDFDDYGEFGYQLEPEYTEEELRQMEEAASAQRREIENNPRQNDTNLISIDIHLAFVLKTLSRSERASDLKMLISFPFFPCHFWYEMNLLCEKYISYIFHVFSEARDHILILNILFFNKLRQIHCNSWSKKWNAGFTYFYLHSENYRYIHSGSLSRVPNIA